MKNFVIIVQIISSAVLIIFVLIQSRGTGFGRSWGGSSSFTRRGVEKMMYQATFIVAALFIVFSLLQLVI